MYSQNPAEQYELELLRAEAAHRTRFFGDERLAADSDNLSSPAATEQFMHTVQAICGPSFYDSESRSHRWLYLPDGFGVTVSANPEATNSPSGDELTTAYAAAHDVRLQRRKLARFIPKFIGSYMVSDSIYVSDHSHARLLQTKQPKGLLAVVGILRPDRGSKFATEAELKHAEDKVLKAVKADDALRSSHRGYSFYPED